MTPGTWGRLAQAVGFAIQFFPLSLFATYALWPGAPVPHERWTMAFKLGATAAGLQLAVALIRKLRLNRLVLGSNIYLLVGGLAAFARRWEVLNFYGVLAESAIFVSMLLVGIVTTSWSPAGYVGVAHADRARVRHLSTCLLALTLVALGVSMAFRGNAQWSVGVPLMLLAFANRYLAGRLKPPAAFQQPPSTP